MSARVPLSVLDLVPIASGDTPAGALRKTLDLARRSEAAGYARYWLAEHHLNPGIAGSAPHTLLAALGAVTTSIRLGTAATILGNYRALQVAEAFGTAGALYGPRFDLGLGRSGTPSAVPREGTPAGVPREGTPSVVPREGTPSLVPREGTPVGGGLAGAGAAGPVPAVPGAVRAANRIVDGLVVPPPFAFPHDAARFVHQAGLLGRVPGDADRFEADVDALLTYFAGTAVDHRGEQLPVHPAESSGVDVWVHGSTAGESARIAGERGLPYGANYHVAPSSVLESVAAYRAGFRPGVLAAPHVIVSVDVVVGRDEAEAQELSLGYDLWVDSIRCGAGALPYPSPASARAHPLDAAARAGVQDRLDTRFVGDPATVVAHLETLQRATGADELLVTTVTHSHAARVRSYELLADAWRAPAPRPAAADLASA